MKNLAILTHTANRLENGPKRIDRRTLPVCADKSCMRKVEALAGGGHISHCYAHAGDEEKQEYRESWCGLDLEPKELLDLLSQGLATDP